MKRIVTTVVSFAVVSACSSMSLSAQRTASREGSTRSWRAVDSALGRKGAMQPGDVMKYSFPRSDLDVTVDGVRLKAAFALSSWVAFKRAGRKTIAMGDFVLTENEVGPVMTRLQSGGVEQTALHNHVLGESPRVMYMHISSHGDELTIARTIREALGLTGVPLAASAATAVSSIELDTVSVASALGYRGKVNGGVYQVSVPRAQKIMENGMEVPASMGLATTINFQPVAGGRAAITGDFVMTADEVNRVIRVLQSNHIQPTALHSHMLAESPRLFFMHFWAVDNAVSLARALRAALAEMRVPPAARRSS